MSNVIVLLPVYSKDKLDFFISSFNSIARQTYLTHILILIDGEVENDMMNYLKLVSNENKFVVTMFFPTNRGLAAVLNDGIRYCMQQGYEFIARMDADDIALPERIEKQINFMISHPEVDVVGGAIEEIDEKGNPKNKIVQYPLTHQECYRFFSKRDPLAHPAVMFRKRFFEKAGWYDEKYRKNQDTQLWYQGFKNGCIFANLPDVILQFRVSDAFYKSRRGGWKRALQMLKDRIKINKELNYSRIAYLYALGMFFITIAPTFVRKLAYKFLR